MLTRVVLSHFRSHKRLTMALDGRPVALFGPNGAGKTNILEAVSLLSPGRGLRRALAEDLARRPEALGWKVEAELAGLDGPHEVTLRAPSGGAREVRIDGKPASQLALGRLVRVLWLVPSMDRLWIEGAEGRRRFLDRMVLSFEPGHADVSLGYEKAMRERNRLFKDGIHDPHWFAALEAQMAQAGAAIQANRVAALAALTAAQEGAATAFPVADLRLTQGGVAEIAMTAEELRAGFAAGRARDMAAGRALSGPHRVDLEAVYTAKGIAANQCSTGEQKALLISLILANARALANGIGLAPVLLLDEVAAHLDDARRAALYDEICGLGAQAWMTGTGAELFDSLGSRAQMFGVAERDGVSQLSEVTG